MKLSMFATLTPAARRTRRNHALKPSLDGLEARLVLSHGVAHPAAMIHTLATPAKVSSQPSIPLTLTGLNITNVTSDATGLITATGTATGKLAGHTFTTPLTLTAAPQASTTGTTTSSVPVLDLRLDPIHLNLLGLKVDTSPICLDITANQGSGNLLGNLVGQIANLLNPGTTGTGTTGTPTLPTAAQLNSILSNTSLVSGLSTILGQATHALGSTSSVTSAATKVLDLSVGPVNLNLLGLQVTADNCSNGPITVDITAQSGPGRLLGNLITDVAHLLDHPGRSLGRLTLDMRQIIGRVTSAHLA